MILQLVEHIFYTEWTLLITIFCFRALAVFLDASFVHFIKNLIIFDGTET